MSQKAILALDTSVLNRLVKDPDPEPFIAAILSGYAIRIPTMSFEEILATRDPDLRKKLHDICRRLLRVGMCIMPAHWVVDVHVKQFHEDPEKYSWLKVQVRATIVEEEIQCGDFVDDDVLVELQAKELRRLQDEFEDFFQRSNRTTNIPTTFGEWLVESRAEGGSFWNTARLLYEGAFGLNSAVDTSVVLASPPDEAALKSFLDACPPVRGFVYALELTLYDRSLRPARVGPAYKAGRNDQMMSVFLPYCDQFLTADGGQQKSLHEVASSAGIPVQVRLYDDFCSSLLVGVAV
jgi:hypothetical protein